MKRPFIMLVLILLIPSISSATQYYVDKDSRGGACSDSNAGTLAQPWCNISKANQVLRAGDTVYIRQGTYLSDPIKPANSGTSSGRIVYASHPGEMATLNGRDSGCAVYISAKDYITVDRVRIEDWLRGVILYNGSDHNIISNCQLYEIDFYVGSQIAHWCVDPSGNSCSESYSVYGLPCNYNRFLNNNFLDAPTSDGCKCSNVPCATSSCDAYSTKTACDGTSGCRWCTNVSSTTCWVDGEGCTYDCETQPADHLSIGSGVGNIVEGNRFGNCSHTPLSTAEMANRTVFRNNTFENRLRRGFSQQKGSYLLAEHNRIYDPGSGSGSNPNSASRNQDQVDAGNGIQMTPGGTDKWEPQSNDIFRRNIIYNAGTSIILSGRNNRFYHNTAYKAMRSLDHTNDDVAGLKFKNNIFSDIRDIGRVTEQRPGHLRITVQGSLCKDYLTQQQCQNASDSYAKNYCTWENGRCRGELCNSNLFTHNDWYPEGNQWRYCLDSGGSIPKNTLAQVEDTWPDQWPRGKNLLVDPLLNNPDAHDFTLRSNSPMIDAGDFLTNITSPSSGSTSSLRVNDSLYFYDGWGIPGEAGDRIKTEHGKVTLIQSIDYQNHILTVSPAISIVQNEGVALYYEGARPDIGAFEYSQAAPACPNGACDQGEACSTCPQDCGCTSPSICCSGTCQAPICTQASQCGSDPCRTYTCSSPGTCSATCSSVPKTACQSGDSCCPPGCTSQTDSDCAASKTYPILKSTSPVSVDGILSEFSQASPITITNSRGTTGNYRLLWDEQALHISAQVSDSQLAAAGMLRDSPVWNDDSIELFFDTDNNKSLTQDSDDYKFIVSVLNVQRDEGSSRGGSWNCTFQSAALPSGTVNVSGNTDSGYAIEISIPWTSWGIPAPSFSRKWGFDLSMNDRNDSGTRLWAIWANLDGDTNLNNPSGWGTLLFTSRADTNQDGCISQSELFSFIALWYQDSTAYPMRELIEGMGKWKAGMGC